MPISPDSDESIPTKQRQEFTAMTMRVLDEQWQQDNPLDVVEEIVTANEWPFDRQGDDELLGELRVGAFLKGLDLVPERFGGAGDRAVGDHLTRPFRRIGGKQKFLVSEIALARIIDGPRLGRMFHLRAVAVGGRQHGTAPVSASDDLGREMRDGHGDSDPGG